MARTAGDRVKETEADKEREREGVGKTQVAKCGITIHKMPMHGCGYYV